MWGWFKSNHEEIRTLVFLVAAVVGFGIACWRTWIAHRQAGAAERASKTAEQNRLNEQFGSGVELFTHAADDNTGGSLVKRLGAASAPAEMAKLYPEELHVRVMDLFATAAGRNDDPEQICSDPAESAHEGCSPNIRAFTQPPTAAGVRADLESLGIFLRMQDGRVNIPDVFRVGYGLGRRGGRKPTR